MSLHWHRWTITSLWMDGHQSHRTRRCRCGRTQSQLLSYFGKPIGKWGSNGDHPRKERNDLVR